MARKTLAEILGGKTRFGDYVVIGEGSYSPKARMVSCRCKCGVVKDVGSDKLRSGRSTCCKACAAGSPKRKTNVRHGMSCSSEYRIWQGMIARCTNPNEMHFADYGARGIAVCDRWRTSFEAFFADMGARPSSRHSLDRKDNDGDYEPSNCRWAIPIQQATNRRRTLKTEFGGVVMPTAMLARSVNIEPATLAARLQRGWKIADAVGKPVENRKPRHLVGTERLTASEIQARFGVSRQRLNYRLRQGMSVEDAIALG